MHLNDGQWRRESTAKLQFLMNCCNTRRAVVTSLWFRVWEGHQTNLFCRWQRSDWARTCKPILCSGSSCNAAPLHALPASVMACSTTSPASSSPCGNSDSRSRTSLPPGTQVDSAHDSTHLQSHAQGLTCCGPPSTASQPHGCDAFTHLPLTPTPGSTGHQIFRCAQTPAYTHTHPTPWPADT